MKKKIMITAAAAALFTFGATLTSFASTGWVQENGTWYYNNADGTRAEDVWKKSGDNWYWLSSELNGAMATDSLIEDDEYLYFVDGSGAMRTNTWVMVANEEQDDENPAEHVYYYMQSNGRAYKAGSNGISLKTINGQRYAFDDDAQMLYGWVNADGERLTDEDEWASVNEDIRYFGHWNDGAMKTGWQFLNVYDDDESDYADYWFFFNSNGTRFYNDTEDSYDTKSINGRTYGFDERGVMVSEWNIATGDSASAANWSYFNSPEDGARVTKGWFRVVAPSDDNIFTSDIDSFDPDGADDEITGWYYADSDGNLYQNEIAKINNKYYAFGDTGRMLSGLVLLDMDPDTEEITVLDDEVDSDDLDQLLEDNTYGGSDDIPVGTGSLYYFSGDEEGDGSMKTGTVSISIDGENETFYFENTGGIETRGKGLTGVDDNKYIYSYGKRIKADSDDKYILVKATGDTDSEHVSVEVLDRRYFRLSSDIIDSLEYDSVNDQNSGIYIRVKINDLTALADYENIYLVNTSGTITKNKTAAKDGSDWCFFVDDYRVKAYANDSDIDNLYEGTNPLGDWEDFTP